MTSLPFVLSSLKSRWLNSTLSILLTAFGVMLLFILLQSANHIHNRLIKDGQNIDIVVSAKGSPLQIILSSVYHIDIPTGNMPYDTAQKWMKHPHVETAIPLALGDNWRGFRIVGTTPDYIVHYNAQLRQGHLWDAPFEAVVGADTGLAIGDSFSGAHGLGHGGHTHDGEKYHVTGVLNTTGTVLDRLILTSLDSVLILHNQAPIEAAQRIEHHDAEHDHHHDHHHDHEHTGHDGHEEAHDTHDHHESKAAEITALLLTTKTPIATMNLPRTINADSALQAANPALEMARLTTMLGMGSAVFTALAIILVTIASLSIFVGLAGSLENRSGDLAVLRAIGYAKARIFRIIILEGFLIVFCGVLCGTILGAGGFYLMAHMIPPLAASGATVHLSLDFIIVIGAVCGAGLFATLIPAFNASRINVAKQLAQLT